jgi:hypothetical protein
MTAIGRKVTIKKPKIYYLKCWDNLQLLDYKWGKISELKRHCASCAKDVINISEFNEDQVKALLKVDSNQCIYATEESQDIEFVESDNTHEHNSYNQKPCCNYNIVPELDYANSDGVNDGMMAQQAYLELIDSKTDKNQVQVITKSLLKYCELDTYAMVKLVNHLSSKS